MNNQETYLLQLWKRQRSDDALSFLDDSDREIKAVHEADERRRREELGRQPRAGTSVTIRLTRAMPDGTVVDQCVALRDGEAAVILGDGTVISVVQIEDEVESIRKRQEERRNEHPLPDTGRKIRLRKKKEVADGSRDERVFERH